ncbi:MAG TPA: cytochrome c biogenesis protein CcsA [Rubrivivax sp.]|nr:cytochrome c biogenesis protein CcsA [Burkholderiales bacterium]HNT38571.1 cytochrome c biogenesis protein CcsA [Rubrivivax sp.]
MILSSGSATALASGWVGAAAGVLYAMAAVRGPGFERVAARALPAAWLVHLLALLLDLGGTVASGQGTRLGFAPVLSLTVWIVIGLHGVESRFVPLPAVRGWLAPVGLLVVLLAAFFPGEPYHLGTPAAALHFVLGIGAYGLFGAAVLHGVLLDAAERRLRLKRPLPGRGAGADGTASSGGGNGSRSMPLLQLERLTFRFVEVGFVVLSATELIGLLDTVHWRWDHKTVFSVLSWVVFAALVAGRRLYGWRGRRATRWLYVGTVLLLLAYVGSRFVLEVLLGRAPG